MKQVLSSIAVRVGGVVLGFGAQIAFARSMSIEDYGAYAFATQVMLAVAVAAPLGLDRAIVRFVPALRMNGDAAGASHLAALTLAVTLTVSLFTAIGLRLGAEAFAPDDADTAVRRLAAVSLWEWTLPGMACLLALQQVLRSLHRAVVAQVFEQVVVPLGLLGGGLLLLRVQMSDLQSIVLCQFVVYSFVAFALVATAVRALGGMRCWPVRARHLSSAELRSAASALWISGIVAMLLARSDLFLVGWLLPAEDAAQYSVAVRISGLMIFGLYAADLLAGPRVAEAWERGDRGELRRLYWNGVKVSAGFATPLLAVGIGAPEWLLSFFGEEFAGASEVLIVLLIGRFLQSVCGPIGLFLSMTGHHRFYAVALALVLLGELVTLPLVIPGYGLRGAATVVSVSIAVWSAVLIFLVQKVARISLYAAQRPSV